MSVAFYKQYIRQFAQKIKLSTMRLNVQLIKDSAKLNQFSEVVMTLLEAGVSRYFVDIVSGKKTYYNDTSFDSFESEKTSPSKNISDIFDLEKLKGAVKWAQSGDKEYTYAKFSKLIEESGVVGYTVFFEGQMVHYFGAKGELHVEKFSQKP